MSPTPSRRNPLVLAAAFAAVVLAGCAGPRDSFPSFPDDGLAQGIGGLTASQVAQLRGLGVPVVVPGDPGDFVLAVVEAGRQEDGSRTGAVSYVLDYRRSDGVCFEISGGNDGFGGPDVPLVSIETRVDGLGGQPVRVYQAADVAGATSAQVWGLNTVVSDFINLDGAAALFLSDSQNGCRPVSLEEGAQIVSGLRLLAAGPPRPVTGGAIPRIPGTGQQSNLGAFGPADDVLNGLNTASTPEIAAQAIARRYDDADRTSVDILSETSYEAVALVTRLGVRDDSVRDERLRLTYTRVGDAWELIQAGRQVRCQSGRGHSDWGDAACR